MKKFMVLFLVFLCISFNIINPLPVFAQNTLKQGIYKVSDLNIPQNKFYTVQNFSKTNTSFIQFFDGNGKMIQAINLTPNSLKYDIIALDPNFTIVILGDGDVSID
ncbi:hypothetical protein psyc5s11_42420 [Clostridium gelidum]|uniref:Uncharacterized protein n=1 Tax=Clostridium gelidum TaxID=704125 RepID=A0ABM7TAM9_9CLOT|nr:hypothetical protein [Clostridium gelidum]BCZ48175.1 hypothetical protein psyc5s11_42420 [Clostridium gelidum]